MTPRQKNELEIERLGKIEGEFKGFGKAIYATCKASEIITSNEFILRIGKLYDILETRLSKLNAKAGDKQ